MKSNIPYALPSITSLEVKYATDAAKNGWGPNCNDYINRFESLFKDHLNVKYSVATSSCTGALHLGMAALGIGPGDEVIMADINWIATAAPVVHLGAQAVFVDVLPDSWCIDPDRVEEAITPYTKAIVAVHLYGNLCDLDRLLAIGEKYGIPVIEDAAEAIGSKYKNARAGSLGTFSAFSFHGTKTVSTGEGGMFVTNDPHLYDRVCALNNHGRIEGQEKNFWPEMVGFKYRMSNLQAAIGCAQMERVNELIDRKRYIFTAYREALNALPVTMNPQPKGTQNGFWMPTVVVDQGVDFDRKRLFSAFRKEGIDVREFFWPLSSLPMFSGHPTLPVSYRLSERGFNLPSYHDLEAGEIARVASVVHEFFA